MMSCEVLGGGCDMLCGCYEGDWWNMGPMPAMYEEGVEKDCRVRGRVTSRLLRKGEIVN